MHVNGREGFTVNIQLTITEAMMLMNITKNPSVEPSKEPEEERNFRCRLFGELVDILGDAVDRKY